MRHIKLYETFQSEQQTHPYFPEVLQCILNTYEDNLGELQDEINELSGVEDWGDFIYSCLNDDDKKDFGRVFVEKYFDGPGLEKLVEYLKGKLTEVGINVT